MIHLLNTQDEKSIFIISVKQVPMPPHLRASIPLVSLTAASALIQADRSGGSHPSKKALCLNGITYGQIV